jgi:hypothetical protein
MDVLIRGLRVSSPWHCGEHAGAKLKDQASRSSKLSFSIRGLLSFPRQPI